MITTSIPNEIYYNTGSVEDLAENFQSSEGISRQAIVFIQREVYIFQ